MREKELRIALVCYGGVSLAVYMHGITKEIWRLAKASQAVHSSDARKRRGDDVYATAARARSPREADVDLRVLVDILAGASAGGINAVFLGHAIATGQTLDPLTDLWLDSADVDAPARSGRRRDRRALAKLRRRCRSPGRCRRAPGRSTRRSSPAHRAEIKAKLANFVRAPWFAPPFSGAGADQPAPRRVRRRWTSGPKGDAAAARLSAARPVRHRHRFPRLSRAAAAQLARPR